MSSLPPALNFAEMEEDVCKQWKEGETFAMQDKLSRERGDKVRIVKRTWLGSCCPARLSSLVPWFYHLLPLCRDAVCLLSVVLLHFFHPSKQNTKNNLILFCRSTHFTMDHRLRLDYHIMDIFWLVRLRIRWHDMLPCRGIMWHVVLDGIVMDYRLNMKLIKN